MILRAAGYGAIAGAAGTTALDAATYADMVIRGRPASELPEKMVAELARRAGINELAAPQELLTGAQRNQRAGLAALLGYVDGVGSGVLFGLLRSTVMKDVSWWWAGIGLGLFTMVLGEGIATAVGQTDPRTWGVSGWIADIAPRCLYGWTTAISFDCLADGL